MINKLPSSESNNSIVELASTQSYAVRVRQPIKPKMKPNKIQMHHT